MAKIFFLALLTGTAFMNIAHADEYADLIAYREQLKQQISAIDSEITRCEKSMKNWKTATIIGGIGAAASGIGIIAQTHQIKENDKNLQIMSDRAKTADEIIEFVEKVK